MILSLLILIRFSSSIMANQASLCLFFFSFLSIFSSGFSHLESTSAGATFFQKNKIFQSQIPFSGTDLNILSNLRRSLEDVNNNSPTTGYPTNPASTTSSTITPPAAINPPNTPTIITVPSTNPPVTVSPTNPTATPVTVPSSTPPVPLAPTNPANSPVPITNPVSSPITSYPPPSGTTTVPITNPQAPPGNTATSSGQSWCVAKSGVSQTTLQTALDYACGTGTADCSQIQQGGSCYNPNSLQNHASVAFNSYYQKNPAPTSCDFGGVATITNTNPSSGSCIYPSASGGAGTSGSGSGSNTPSSAFGPQSPPDLDSSHSIGLRPFVGCIVLVISWFLEVLV